jgi:excisionase family DNA binding protein
MKELGQIKLFTPDEVAGQLGTTPARIRKFIKEGQLAARRVGRTYYITENKLQEFLECSPEQPAPRPKPPAGTVDMAEDMADDMSRIDAILGQNNKPVIPPE